MAVKYKIEFESNAHIRYRVDIYDANYSGAPIELIGGATPFTTEEDASDDFFTPIRTSTGTLSIVNGETANGTPIDIMEEVVPINNTAYPMILVKVVNGVDIVEWQGFLSCEAYEQEFTDNVREISINCNSALAAADSIYLEESNAGIKTIRYMIWAILNAIDSKGSTIVNIHYPTNGEELLEKYMDSTVFYDQEEICNENNVTYEPVITSCKEVLAKIATFAGWCVREVGQDIYITRIGDDGLQFTTLAGFLSGALAVQESETPIVLDDDFEWNGDSHSKSVVAGAHSVKVIANLEEYKLGLGLPETPYTNLVEVETETNETEEHEEMIVPLMYYMLYTLDGHQSLTFNTYRYEVRFNPNSRHDQVDTISYDHGAVVTRQQVIDQIVLVMGENSPAYKLFHQSDAQELRAGSFLCKKVFEPYVTGRRWHDVKDALYCAFIPVYSENYFTTITNPAKHKILTMAKSVPFACSTGYLRIYGEGQMIANTVNRGTEVEHMELYFQLKCGNHYWDAEHNTWGSDAKIFPLDIIGGKVLNNWDETLGVEEADGHFIRVDKPIYGKVELSLYDQVGMTSRMGWETRNFLPEMIFEEFGVDYSALINAKNNKRGENSYYRLLSLDFTDYIEINTDFATDMNNIDSPSIIVETSNGSQKTSKILYEDGAMRPEQDLLNRMATHYGAAKRKLTLQVEHPTEPLPLMRVIDTDDRVYIPVAESRDYAADSSELTLLEV